MQDLHGNGTQSRGVFIPTESSAREEDNSHMSVWAFDYEDALRIEYYLKVKLFGKMINALNFYFSCLFALSEMVQIWHAYDGIQIYSENEVKALEHCFSQGDLIWIHGTQSKAFKTLLCDRNVSTCSLIDKVMPVDGFLTNNYYTFLSSLAVLSADLFCRSIWKLAIWQLFGGIRERKQVTSWPRICMSFTMAHY